MSETEPLADWLRDWRLAECEHWLPRVDNEPCCSPCLRDRITAHLAAILADVETVEALAEAIHSHMKAVRDRGDYIVGPASDDAARAAIAVLAARLGVTL